MAALGSGSYTTQFAYNNQNQPQQITYPSLDSNNPTIAFSYDRLGRLAAVGYPDPNDGVIDPSNPPPAPSQRYAFYQYDLNGRLLNATMNTAPQIQQFLRTYSYNANGWLTGIADPYFNEQVGYMGADALNYLNGTIANYTVQYNPSANWTTPPLAVYASFAYDNYGRLITEKVQTPTGIALDGWSGSIAAYDANGNMGTLTQGQTSTAYSYATDGAPPVQVSNQVTTLGANVQNSVNFDNVAPSQQSANGWWWGSNNGGPSGTGVTQTQHPPNLVQSLELTGGSLGHYEVFRLNTFLPPTATLTLSWQVLTGAGYGQEIGAAAWFAVLYTAEGETVSVPIAAIPAANSWQTQTAQIPLAAWAATYGGGNVVQMGLELRNQSRTANGSTGPSIFIAAPSLTGSISAPAYQYDRDGNITQAMARSLYVLNYDAVTGLTRSIQIGSSTGNLLNFSYGLDDNRTLKTYQTSGGSPTVLSQALTLTGLDGQPLAERVTTGTNTNVQYFIPGIGGSAAIIANGSPKILLRDHLGSLRVVVDSETAAVDNSFDYLSFGGMIRASNQPEVSRLFTGQDLDQETGLYDYRARLYDISLGRFYAVDAAGGYASPYSYVGNDPLNRVDPTGNVIQFFSPLLYIFRDYGFFANKLQHISVKEKEWLHESRFEFISRMSPYALSHLWSDNIVDEKKRNAMAHFLWQFNIQQMHGTSVTRFLANLHETEKPGPLWDTIADKINNEIAFRRADAVRNEWSWLYHTTVLSMLVSKKMVDYLRDSIFGPQWSGVHSWLSLSWLTPWEAANYAFEEEWNAGHLAQATTNDESFRKILSDKATANKYFLIPINYLYQTWGVRPADYLNTAEVNALQGVVDWPKEWPKLPASLRNYVEYRFSNTTRTDL